MWSINSFYDSISLFSDWCRSECLSEVHQQNDIGRGTEESIKNIAFPKQEGANAVGSVVPLANYMSLSNFVLIFFCLAGLQL